MHGANYLSGIYRHDFEHHLSSSARLQEFLYHERNEIKREREKEKKEEDKKNATRNEKGRGENVPERSVGKSKSGTETE